MRVCPARWGPRAATGDRWVPEQNALEIDREWLSNGAPRATGLPITLELQPILDYIIDST